MKFFVLGVWVLSVRSCIVLLYECLVSIFLYVCVISSCFMFYYVFIYCFPALSRRSIENNLSTSSEVVVWTAYTLPSPDPTLWEYTGYVVVVVNY